jgi:hypothetical protein
VARLQRIVFTTCEERVQSYVQERKVKAYTLTNVKPEKMLTRRKSARFSEQMQICGDSFFS